MDSQVCENADATIDPPQSPSHSPSTDDPETEEKPIEKNDQKKPLPKKMRKPKRNLANSERKIKKKCKPVDLDGNPIRRSFKKVSDAVLRQKLAKMSETLARYELGISK